MRVNPCIREGALLLGCCRLRVASSCRPWCTFRHCGVVRSRRHASELRERKSWARRFRIVVEMKPSVRGNCSKRKYLNVVLPRRRERLFGRGVYVWVVEFGMC